MPRKVIAFVAVLLALYLVVFPPSNPLEQPDPNLSVARTPANCSNARARNHHYSYRVLHQQRRQRSLKTAAGGSLPYLSGGGGASFPNLNDSDLWEEAQKLKTRDYQPKVPPWLDVEYTTESTLSADTIRQQNPRLAALLDYGAKDRLPPGMIDEMFNPSDSSADSSVRERHEQKYEDAKIDIMKGFARLGKSHEEIMSKPIVSHRQFRRIMEFRTSLYQQYRRDMGEYGKVETHAGFQVKDLSKMSLDERYLRAHRNVENEIRYCFDLTVSPDSQTVYLADSDNGTIKRIPHEGGKVELWTGNPVLYPIPEDGVGSAAQFKMPLGIHYGSGGYLYVADTGHSIIRKISPDRNVTSLGYFHNFDHPHGSYWDGVASKSRFNYVAFHTRQQHITTTHARKRTTHTHTHTHTHTYTCYILRLFTPVHIIYTPIWITNILKKV